MSGRSEAGDRIRTAGASKADAGRARECDKELATPASAMPAAYIRANRAPVFAAASVAGSDVAVLAAHYLGHPYGYAGIAVLSAAAGARLAWLFRRAAARRPAARRRAAVLWGASSSVAMVATATGVATGPGQAAMLAGGFAVAAPYLWHSRWRPPKLPPPPPPEPPKPDPHVEAFRQRFCQSGVLKGAEIHSPRKIPDGFAFEVLLPQQSEATTRDVVALIPKIAALYDVSADQVSVEYTGSRSERRALISVLTRQNAWDKDDRWDGRSTYDPERGWFRLGRFADAADAHWLLHRPGSGAAGGVVAGTIGSGKTGSTHVIACEAGLAKLCTACGGARSCDRCDMRRFVAVWMGDPQMQPFAVWNGFADLTAWGPSACAHMILMAYMAMRERAARFGAQKWTDHLGRENTGRGSFDPDPGNPILYVIVDEWPLIVADPVLFAIVAPFAAAVVKEGRKVGVVLVLLTQMPDLTQMGLRELRELLKAFNVLAHRTDCLSKHMLGVQGDTSALAPGVHGLGYLAGADGRPAAVMRTKHLPEYVRPGERGPDVRDLAERISRSPVTLDAAVVAAITPLGWEGPRQVLDGSLFDEAVAAAAAGSMTKQANSAAVDADVREIVARRSASPPGAPSDEPRKPAPPPSGPSVYLPLLAVMLADRGEMDLFDVSEVADVDAFEADKALAALAAQGLAEQIGPGRYRTRIARPTDREA